MRPLAQETQRLLGITLSSLQLEQFSRYQKELASWNKRMNLTAIHEPELVRVKHFLDSLSCLLVMHPAGKVSVVDVGTGAGFPGLVLKIVRPEIQLTMIESTEKKTIFLEHIVQVLDLENIEILNMRAEVAGQSLQYRQCFDWALARAVAPLPVLVEYLLPLVKIGGRILAQKGENGPAETQSSENAIHVLGGQLRELRSVELPGIAEERWLIVIDKIAATPEKYPRREGIPAKRPL
jgi:16S rRNA (guanine527-N7)-methyltransferase